MSDWFEAMRRADFAAAWRVSDRVVAERKPGETCWDMPRHEQWVWDGRPLANQRVLVRCYHGLGDTIQFARCLPMLDALARETIVWAPPTLIDLLRTLSGERRLLPLHEGTPEVEYDVDVEIMELGHALRLDAEGVGQLVPYFHVEPALRPSSRLTIGIVASTGAWDGRRSIPVDLLSPLTRITGGDVFNLQLDNPIPGARDWSTPEVLELARRVRALDLVIAPDTMVAHLAGALAVPTWTMLPHDADWRWHQPRRSDSPWYPTMRLFRQRRPGDWESVVNEVAEQLALAVDR